MPLDPEGARQFYDRFGARQDHQAFYEDAALRVLVEHAAFERAHAVVELGCGTGRFAEELLAGPLPPEARYLGLDVSETMVRLARERLARFGERAEVRQTDGAVKLDLPDGAFDRFVSTYVLDLLPEADVDLALAEAHRVLAPGGRLAVASLTFGTALVSRAIVAAWRAVHAVRPQIVGGCRPLRVAARLEPGRWRIVHAEVVTAWGLPSEAVVAERLA